MSDENSSKNKDLSAIAPNLEKKKAKEKALQEEIDKQAKKYEDGQILRFVRVRFPGNSKSFPFLIGKRRITHGQKVVAMSDRGLAVGYVNSFPYELEFNKNLLPLRSINKIATDEDIEKQKESYRKEKEVEVLCRELIEKYNLDMNLTHLEFTQFGKKTVFYFTAPQRVDFRQLVKDLVTKLKTRIELRQISLRDRAAGLGGIGPCGNMLCCSSFLAKYGNVSVKMGRNQNLTLNYSKLNGVCGQLKCCLQYEDEVYSAKRRKLPREGDFIETAGGDKGKVDKLHILLEQFELLTDEGVIRRYSINQYIPGKKPSSNWNFPKRFDHISRENAEVIGQEKYQEEKQRRFEKDLDKITPKGEVYADQKYGELFSEIRINEHTGKAYAHQLEDE